MPRLAVMIDRERTPESLIATARELEQLGIDDIWVVEDLGWAGGISAAATVLAVTDRVRVGLGIAPAPLRNPALLAMEVAALARMHPGRFVAGIGHGVQDWMRQAGAHADSPMALLEETFAAVRGLLAGERVTLEGREVHLDDVALVHPASVPLLAGVTGPRSLALATRVADGVILVEGSGRAELDAARAGAPEGYEVVVLTHAAVGPDVAAEVESVAQGFFGGTRSDFTMVAGTPEVAAAVVRGLWSDGADTVVLRPVGEPVEQVRALLGALV